jgi:type IV pilus assembly protein PilV
VVADAAIPKLENLVVMRSDQINRSDRMNSIRMPEKREGFVIVEVLVAITILSFGLLAIASMQTTALQGSAFARHVTEGTNWAQDRMEVLLALPYGDPLLSGGADLADPNPPSPDGYTITYDVTNNSPVNNSKEITVKVQWRDRWSTKSAEVICVKPEL